MFLHDFKRGQKIFFVRNGRRESGHFVENFEETHVKVVNSRGLLESVHKYNVEIEVKHDDSRAEKASRPNGRGKLQK